MATATSENNPVGFEHCNYKMMPPSLLANTKNETHQPTPSASHFPLSPNSNSAAPIRSPSFVQQTTSAVVVEYEEVLLKRVESSTRLGLTLCYDGDHCDTDIFVNNIEAGSVAAQTNRIYVGDQLLQVNGKTVRRRRDVLSEFTKNPNEVLLLIARVKKADKILQEANEEENSEESGDEMELSSESGSSSLEVFVGDEAENLAGENVEPSSDGEDDDLVMDCGMLIENKGFFQSDNDFANELATSNNYMHCSGSRENSLDREIKQLRTEMASIQLECKRLIERRQEERAASVQAINKSNNTAKCESSLAQRRNAATPSLLIPTQNSSQQLQQVENMRTKNGNSTQKTQIADTKKIVQNFGVKNAKPDKEIKAETSQFLGAKNSAINNTNTSNSTVALTNTTGNVAPLSSPMTTEQSVMKKDVETSSGVESESRSTPSMLPFVAETFIANGKVIVDGNDPTTCFESTQNNNRVNFSQTNGVHNRTRICGNSSNINNGALPPVAQRIDSVDSALISPSSTNDGSAASTAAENFYHQIESPPPSLPAQYEKRSSVNLFMNNDKTPIEHQYRFRLPNCSSRSAAPMSTLHSKGTSHNSHPRQQQIFQPTISLLNSDANKVHNSSKINKKSTINGGKKSQMTPATTKRPTVSFALPTQKFQTKETNESHLITSPQAPKTHQRYRPGDIFYTSAERLNETIALQQKLLLEALAEESAAEQRRQPQQQMQTSSSGPSLLVNFATCASFGPTQVSSKNSQNLVQSQDNGLKSTGATITDIVEQHQRQMQWTGNFSCNQISRKDDDHRCPKSQVPILAPFYARQLIPHGGPINGICENGHAPTNNKHLPPIPKSLKQTHSSSSNIIPPVPRHQQQLHTLIPATPLMGRSSLQRQIAPPPSVGGNIGYDRQGIEPDNTRLSVPIVELYNNSSRGQSVGIQYKVQELRSPPPILHEQRPGTSFQNGFTQQNRELFFQRPADVAAAAEAAADDSLKYEWKVKRRSDGSFRFIRRPIKSDVKVRREEQLNRERHGFSTDDDAASDLKLGRFWRREERRQHLMSARQRKESRQRESHNNNKTMLKSITDERHQMQEQKTEIDPVVGKHLMRLTEERLRKRCDRELMDTFHTIQEFLAQGNRSGATRRVGGILSVTTV